MFEYPSAEGDPYYPVPKKENAALYARYKELADEMPNVHFVGRLATYKYYNMDQVTAQALSTYSKMNGTFTIKGTRRTMESNLLSEPLTQNIALAAS